MKKKLKPTKELVIEVLNIKNRLDSINKYLVYYGQKV